MRHKALKSSFFLWATITGCVSIPVATREPVLQDPEKLFSADPAYLPLKVHMLDGTLYALDRWDPMSEEDSTLIGWGRYYDLERVLISDGEFSVPIEAIAVVESNQRNVKRPFGLSVLATQTVLWGVVTALCVADPKSCFGSCPTFYIDESDRRRPVAEGFSSSISRSLEAADIDDLGMSRPGGTTLEIRMLNEALETHAVRYVKLHAIPHDATTTVYATDNGSFLTASRIQTATSCTSTEGDCLLQILGRDSLEYRTETDSTDLGLTESIELTFPSVGANAGLVVEARQTFVSTFLLYQAMAYMGPSAGDWLAQLERNDPATMTAYQNLVDLTGIVHVYASGDGSNWIDVGEYSEAGPIASDVHLIRIPATFDSDSIHIRLEMARGSWRVGYVALASLQPATDGVVLEPAVAAENVNGVDAGSQLLDSERYLITYPGDEVIMTFELPRDNLNYALFLESKGYYYEWMRGEWIDEENPQMTALLFTQPHIALRTMAPQFKDIEQQFEENFWQSRFGR